MVIIVISTTYIHYTHIKHTQNGTERLGEGTKLTGREGRSLRESI
jgi:hypothetical protein